MAVRVVPRKGCARLPVGSIEQDDLSAGPLLTPIVLYYEGNKVDAACHSSAAVVQALPKQVVGSSSTHSVQ